MDQLQFSPAMGWTSMLGVFLLLATVISAVHIQVHKEEYVQHALHALDCRQPTKIQSGLVADICGKPINITTNKVIQDVILLQTSGIRVIKATRCKKQAHRIRMYCGAYSHMKLIESPDVHKEEEFTKEDCKLTTTGVYKREDGALINVQKGRPIRYKYLEHGHLTFNPNNVECQGATFLVNGEQHSGIMQYASLEVLIEEVTIEIDEGSIRDLDANIKLPYACGKDESCTNGAVAYVWNNPDEWCPMYHIRTLPMERIQLTTAKGTEDALISHEHKLTLILRGSHVIPQDCKNLQKVYNTNYDQIKVVLTDDLHFKAEQVTASLIPSVLDLDLELRITDEYLSYKMESMIDDRARQIAHRLCNVNQHSIRTAEISPFHPNALLRISGEVITEVQCTPTTVYARIGDKRSKNCNADALPVWVANHPSWLQSVTRILLEESELQHISCQSQFLPTFYTEDKKLLHAKPDVQELQVRLTHVGEDYLHQDQGSIHETFEEDLLYSSDEIEKFNSLIHFSRSKSNLVSALTEKYCSKSKTCGAYRPPTSSSSFSLQNLEDEIVQTFSIWSHIKSIAGEYGGLCGLVLMAMSICTGIYRLITLCKLYFTHRATPSEALQMTFNLNDMTRRQLIEDARNDASKRKPNTNRQDDLLDATFNTDADYEDFEPIEEPVPVQRSNIPNYIPMRTTRRALTYQH